MRTQTRPVAARQAHAGEADRATEAVTVPSPQTAEKPGARWTGGAGPAVLSSSGVERFRSVVAMLEARAAAETRDARVAMETKSLAESQRKSQEGVATLSQANSGGETSLNLLR